MGIIFFSSSNSLRASICRPMEKLMLARWNLHKKLSGSLISAVFKVFNAWSVFFRACCTTPMWHISAEFCGFICKARLKCNSAKLYCSCFENIVPNPNLQQYREKFYINLESNQQVKKYKSIKSIKHYNTNKTLYKNLPCVIMSGIESDGVTKSSNCFI